MVDHILVIPALVVFCVRCFDSDTTRLCLWNNPEWNKDDIEVVILFPYVYWDTLYNMFMFIGTHYIICLCLLGHPVWYVYLMVSGLTRGEASLWDFTFFPPEDSVDSIVRFF